MKLGAYIIGASNAAELKNSTGYLVSDLNSNDPFQLKDSLDSGYADVGTYVAGGIKNWYKFYKLAGATLDVARTAIKSLIDAQTFDACTDEEKLIGCKWFLVDKATRDAFGRTDEEQLEDAKQLEKLIDSEHEKSILESDAVAIRDGNIYSIAEPEIVELSAVNGKDHTAIDYITELKDGVKLHKEEVLKIDGLVDIVTFYNNYVDAGNKGTEILTVEHVWNVDETETIPAARKVLSRTKTRKWKTKDGNYHTKQKVTTKLYDTEKKKNEEGKRRRENILFIAQGGIATILLLTGTSPDLDDAEGKLIDAFGVHANAIATYIKSGKGSIYDDITNDATSDPDLSWFDIVIGATAQSALGLPAGWDTKNIREYIAEKLKGNI